MKFERLVWIVLFVVTLISCSEHDERPEPSMHIPIEQEEENQDGDSIGNQGGNQNNGQIISPLPIEVIYPANNPHSLQKEELGRFLFWDPILSGGMDISCASCHHPDFAYADGLERSVGVGGNLIDRNSPTVLNTAYNGINLGGNYNPEIAPMFWDNRTLSLESQSIEPILSAVEMRGNQISEDEILDVIIDRLENLPDYVALFEDAFGSDQITETRIAQAISTLERSLLANNSRFDQYMRGNTNALSQIELDGLSSFIDVGCADCHSSPMLSDFELHTLSVPNNGINDMGATGAYDFRTPTLRNITLTAPYMHNGVFGSLEQVLDFYNDISRGNGNNQNNNVADNEIANDAINLNLNNNQIDEIIAFMRTLTDEDFDRMIPASVPSGQRVGGN